MPGAAADPWSEPGGQCRNHRRVGDGHDRLPQCPARSGLGGGLSWQQRERWQTPAGRRPEGQRPSAHGARGGRGGGLAHQGQLSPGQVLPPPGAPGTKRAAMAIGHKILIAAYQMLATRAPYKDLGATYLDGLEKRRTTQHLVRRLQRLGYEVTLGPKVA